MGYNHYIAQYVQAQDCSVCSVRFQQVHVGAHRAACNPSTLPEWGCLLLQWKTQADMPHTLSVIVVYVNCASELVLCSMQCSDPNPISKEWLQLHWEMWWIHSVNGPGVPWTSFYRVANFQIMAYILSLASSHSQCLALDYNILQGGNYSNVWPEPQARMISLPRAIQSVAPAPPGP